MWLSVYVICWYIVSSQLATFNIRHFSRLESYKEAREELSFNTEVKYMGTNDDDCM